MTPRTIPLRSVHDALCCAKVKLIAKTGADGKSLGRFAAMTQYPYWEPTCKDVARSRRLGTPLRRALPQTFGPMNRGDLLQVLDRVRLHNGLGEVRKTWGSGLRALRAEFSDGVLR